jgi:hypothetical protein
MSLSQKNAVLRKCTKLGRRNHWKQRITIVFIRIRWQQRNQNGLLVNEHFSERETDRWLVRSHRHRSKLFRFFKYVSALSALLEIGPYRQKEALHHDPTARRKYPRKRVMWTKATERSMIAMIDDSKVSWTVWVWHAYCTFCLLVSAKRKF